MRVFEVNGGKRLNGCLQVQGAKNSALPILAATLLIRDKSIIHNCPMLSDVDAAIKILVMLGCVCVRDEETVIVDASCAANHIVSKELMSEMRSSIVFLGAIVSRMGKAVISSPGGCELGPRPIDLHISSLKKMGVKIDEEDGYLKCSAPEGIKGTEISLAFPSVGATENIMITASTAKGTTIINNAAKEPEISDLADFLNGSGARISGAGSNRIIIEGVPSLHSCEHRVIPDRIVATTYLSAAALTNGKVKLEQCGAANMISILRFFKEIGCHIKSNGSCIELIGSGNYINTKKIITEVYPGFPTDAGPLVVPLFCRLSGKQQIKETIFKNRFRYVDQLNKFGCDISLKDNTATVNGINNFKCANASCTDLRGGAALVLAALAAEGVSTISDIYHIERGYCKLDRNLKLLGADIKESEI